MEEMLVELGAFTIIAVALGVIGFIVSLFLRNKTTPEEEEDLEAFRDEHETESEQ